MKNTKNKSKDGTNLIAGGLITGADRDSDTQNRDEQLLINQCRHGNMDAFGQLVTTYQHRLYNVLLRMVGHQDDALELTQEAFVRAMQSIKKFRGQSGFYTWLFRIGVNLALSHRQRKKKIHFHSLQPDTDEMGHQADGLAAMMAGQEKSPDVQAQIQEQHQRVLAALAELDIASRAVVVLRDIEGRNYAEIAKILEVPMGTVKSRLARARMALREMLDR